MIRHVAALVSVAAVLVAASSAGCLSREECSNPDNVTRCTGPTTYARCAATENGGSLLIDGTCQDGWTCDSQTGECAGGAAGSACASHLSCADGLRCKAGVCAGPSAQDIARCEGAPVIDAPTERGASVSFDIVFDEDVVLANEILDGICGRDDAGGVPIRRFGLVRVHIDGGYEQRAFFFRFDGDAESGPLTQLVGYPACDQLYARREFTSCYPPAPWRSGGFDTVEHDFAILVGLAADEPTVARFRLERI